MPDKIKVVALMVLATVAVSIGETLLSKGMKQTAGMGGLSIVRATLTNGWAVGGIALMTLYFWLYVSVLQKADLSFVLPITALSYVIAGVLSKFWLHETVYPTRWAGIALITLGVAVVVVGESHGGVTP